MKKKRTLICANDLIDANKDYSAIELRAFYNMIYTFKQQCLFNKFEEDDTVYMPLQTLSKYLGKKNLTTSEIRNLISNMPNRIFFNNGLGFVSAFDFISYDENEMEFQYKLTDSIKPFVDHIINNFIDKGKGNFSVLELEYFEELNSRYSQRMYEFICKNKNLKTYLMRIEDFKNYFDVPSNYKMCNIDDRVLKPVLKDINKNTNFELEINKKKKRNRVTHLEFIIKEKKNEMV